MKRHAAAGGSWLVGGLVLALAAADLRADLYIVRREGAGIVPQQSTEVSMDAEDVLIEEGEYGFMVTATFEMRNQSDQAVSSLVAFPIVGSSYRNLVDLGREFRVELKTGTDVRSPFFEVKARLHQGPAPAPAADYFVPDLPKRVADYPEAIVWEVTWAPAETKTIRVRFEMGEPKVIHGSNDLVRGRQLMYVVSTGALWKGPIGRADISIRLGRNFFFPAQVPSIIRTWSYPEQARWENEHTLSWHFENWIPSEEIWLRSIHWIGLAAPHSRYFFHLPPYEGDRQAYTSGLIEALVRRELALAAQHMPEVLDSLDLIPLKVAVADWLLHEIYARHGDPFYVGKESATLAVGDGLFGDDEGNIYSEWQSRFDAYGRRGGWYRPTYGPAGAVRTAALSPVEQQNVRFLRAYLEELRPQLPPEFQKKPVHFPGLD